MIKHACLIYNPTSGKEKIEKNLSFIINRLRTGGFETICQATSGAGDATRIARSAAEQQFELVIAAGGDGTLNEVINGLAEQPHRPKLGIISAGTTNDFAGAIKLPRSLDGICHVLCTGKEISVDLGKINDQYFINVAASGLFSEISYTVPSKLKTYLGQLAYFIKGIEMLPSIRPLPLEIEYDGHEFTGEVLLFLIANTPSIGGFKKLAPQALIDDGLFELLIVKKMNLLELTRLIPLTINGEHINNQQVIYTKAKRINVKSKMPLNLDGEWRGFLPGEFINLPRHLQVLVP